METEVWILGGAGRAGRAIAAELARRGVAPVLVGRDPARLALAAGQVAGADGAARGATLAAGSLEAMAAVVRERRPAVVINTIGPFAETAVPLARACLPAGHYLDLANDVAAVSAVLVLHQEAAAAGRTLVTGAGFGVTVTESVVVALCAGHPAPWRVRTDMVPSVAVEAGAVGAALAGSLLHGLPGVPGGGRYSGRRYAGGRLTAAPFGGDPARLTLPDGTQVTTVGTPLGELLAAQRASGAPEVIAATSEVPSSRVLRAVMPVAGVLLSIGPVRSFAIRQMAQMKVKARERPRDYSWGHARVEWPDGAVAEGWLRAGEATAFTGAVAAEAARRLLAGEGRPGAYTPAALFGPALAESCGGEYQLAQQTLGPTMASKQ
jgi:short subunit dehydrogenase-like uncharacterized protein